MFHIVGSDGYSTVEITVPDVARLNEIYTMLRNSGTFEDAYFDVRDGDGRTLVDRNFSGIGAPQWWIGKGSDPGDYVQMFPRPPRRDRGAT